MLQWLEKSNLWPLSQFLLEFVAKGSVNTCTEPSTKKTLVQSHANQDKVNGSTNRMFLSPTRGSIEREEALLSITITSLTQTPL